MAQNTQITTAQRMQNFSALTRQNFHMMPVQTVDTEVGTIQFTLPKARVLAKTYLKVDVECTMKHASGTALKPKHDFDLMKIIRKIAMDVNVGFMPVSLSGSELALFNTIATHPDKMIGGGDRLVSLAELKTSAGGTKNKYTFVLEIKNTLNDNALQGLIMLQNQSTTVNMTVDIGSITDVINGQTGYTGTLDKVSVQPCLVTYTIPKDERAYPDISILKVVHSKSETYASAGQKTMYLDCGMIYRKMIFYFEDAEGNAMTPDMFAGNFEIAFNTADVPYSVTPEMLKYMNIDAFGQKLPDGVYVFDFSSQSPLISFGGNRDYIDTGKLTQLTFSFNTNTGCTATLISERISRLTA